MIDKTNAKTFDRVDVICAEIDSVHPYAEESISSCAASEPNVPLVLIVDDDPTTVAVLDRILRCAGLKTLRASSLAEAESLFHANPVVMILLDIHLPDGNGTELCRKLTAAYPVSVLFISGDSDIATKTNGFAAGGVDYITKPLLSAEILARVRVHLRLRAAQESIVRFHAEQIARLSSAQQLLMARPEDFPHAGFQVYLRQALQAGGDFYDVVPAGDKTIDYIVADASGHDLGVSLWTASYKTLLAECVSVVDTPQDTCRSINNSLRRVLPEGVYFTALHVRLNRTAGKLTLVNAGHLPAIFVDGRDGQVRLIEQEGDILGVFADAVFGVAEVPVKTGDRFYLYSDGLVEFGGSREKGLSLATEICRQTFGLPLRQSIDRIVNTLHSGGEPQDDIVLLGVDV